MSSMAMRYGCLAVSGRAVPRSGDHGRHDYMRTGILQQTPLEGTSAGHCEVMRLRHSCLSDSAIQFLPALHFLCDVGDACATFRLIH